MRYPALELIPNFPVPKLWRREFWRALAQADCRSSDVFVSHTRFFLPSLLALACARVVRRPLLHVEHGSDYVQLSRPSMRLAARLYDLSLGRLLLRRADSVLAISHAAADFVHMLAGREEIHVVHRGMWPDRIGAVAPSVDVLEVASGRSVVAFAGRLIDGKGVADLLRAVAVLERPHCLLCIVGDGPCRPELERLADELEIADFTLFLGYMPEEQAWGVMSASDVVVNPSYTEGLPTSVLEAALLGKAIIATDVGGTGEVIDDRQSGLLVPPREVAQLAERLRELLGDPSLRQRLGDAARAQALERFDWHVSARRFARVIEEIGLVGNSGRRRAKDALAPSQDDA